jgi:hypothetical protein
MSDAVLAVVRVGARTFNRTSAHPDLWYEIDGDERVLVGYYRGENHTESIALEALDEIERLRAIVDHPIIQACIGMNGLQFPELIQPPAPTEETNDGK